MHMLTPHALYIHTHSYLNGLSVSLEPRLSLRWLANMSLVTKIAMLPYPPAVLQRHSGGGGAGLAQVALNQTVPPGLHLAHIKQGLQHSAALVKWCVCVCVCVIVCIVRLFCRLITKARTCMRYLAAHPPIHSHTLVYVVRLIWRCSQRLAPATRIYLSWRTHTLMLAYVHKHTHTHTHAHTHTHTHIRNRQHDVDYAGGGAGQGSDTPSSPRARKLAVPGRIQRYAYLLFVYQLYIRARAF